MAGFTGPSVEIDAVPSGTLRALVEDTIRAHVDEDALQATEAAEESEREIIATITATATATSLTDGGDGR